MSTQPILPGSSSLPAALIERFDELLAKLRLRAPDEPLDSVSKAFAFAAERHGAQSRKSGEPYLAHPLEVAHLLADMQLDLVCITTGLLHDTLEDTPATVEDLETLFGREVARCVDGVTKLGRIDLRSAEDRQAESYRKMLLAMVKDIRVILVKLADRVHNMRTLRHLDRNRQRRIALETREIYAPIALRLGMGKVRSELEDLAFAYLEPEAYQQVTHYIETRREASEEFLEELQRDLAGYLAENEVPARLEGRIKRPYSIFLKLERQHIELDQVYDLLALRIITDSKKNCYAALGIIHQYWRPVPDRIKDFIAMPRPNLYQSLHTSVITDQGQRFEVQIRTEDMHRMAEEGICAHWKYKEGRVGPDQDDRRVAWLRQLVEWQRDLKDPSDFLSTLKIDLYPEEVYVFTPQGKLVVLPRGATPLDFAYAIHTEVGHTCVGAKVDGRIVPLKYRLNNGDQIEIITQKGRQPSADWLSLVITSRARHKIKGYLNARRRERAEEIGAKLLEKEARRLKIPAALLHSDAMLEIAHHYGCSHLADLHAQLGYGRYSARQIVSKLEPVAPPPAPEPPPAPTHQHQSEAPLVVRGADDVMSYRARCCNPISGEPIVGYITRGKGVAVHSRDCPNVRNLMYEAERRIDVAWAPHAEATFQTRLTIYVDDRPNIVHDITNILKDEKVNIHSMDSRGGKGPDAPAVVNLTVELTDVDQLHRIMQQIKRLSYVRDVTRTTRQG
ncbi:MAG: bifunctional (p)ppGpp synthetase/guanosine-3',5'-bis(diphosphate) 3'-pyrophosphohydrolase [Bryobacterales bacterium]|nr:bifunctional (p)ppGpp synthetase/guanosine-3',5'-bis(diphosphate) 3'-pyrophosphohydrolase [Bryobacterales bacterium]